MTTKRKTPANKTKRKPKPVAPKTFDIRDIAGELYPNSTVPAKTARARVRNNVDKFEAYMVDAKVSLHTFHMKHKAKVIAAFS